MFPSNEYVKISYGVIEMVKPLFSYFQVPSSLLIISVICKKDYVILSSPQFILFSGVKML